MFKKILQTLLRFFAKRTLKKHNPTVIAITGSVGKTSTKEALYAVLKTRFQVRRSEANFNNEIGVPLTILGAPHYGKNIFRWCWFFCQILFRREGEYPEVLILEYGIDRPRDMDYLLNIAKPDIAVLTAIGEIPVHVEFFSGCEEVAAEKIKLAEALPPDGYAVINGDDAALDDVSKRTKARIVRFGFDEHADIKITHFGFGVAYDNFLQREIPYGASFEVISGEERGLVKIPGVFGKPVAYAAAGAIAVGKSLGTSLQKSVSGLLQYTPVPGRLRLLRGIKNSLILDDSYNSSPQALHAALDTLRDLPAKRKIAVIGDMLELGNYSEEAHRAMGDKIASFADFLITVGPRAKFIAEDAIAGIENKRTLLKNQVLSFDRSEDAGKALDPLVREGDLILVKGSQGMRMERVVEEIMAEPEKAKELLVRQSEYWKRR